MQSRKRTKEQSAAPVNLGELWGSIRALPRAAWILFLGIFLNRFGTFVIPFLTLYLTKKGYSLSEAALAVGSYGVGTLLASVAGGQLADQIGRRKTIAVSMAGGAVTMLLLSFARSWGTIILLTGMNGLCGELYRPASSALLADVVPASQRVVAFSTYRMALNAGWAFGPATAGFLARHSFFWLFLGDALTSILFGLVAWMLLPQGIQASGEAARWRVAWENMRTNRIFLQFLMASFFIAWVFYQISSSYGLFVTRLGYSESVYGALISLNGLIVASLELLLTNWSRRFPPRYCIAVGYLLVGAGFGLNIWASNIPSLALGMFVLTLGEMISLPVAIAYIADLAPESMRGRYMGAHGLTWSLALIVGPGLGMYLFAHSAVWLWSACAFSGCVGAVIILWPQGKLSWNAAWTALSSGR